MLPWCFLGRRNKNLQLSVPSLALHRPLLCLQLLLQRRCYWLLDESQEHIVLVHYLNSSTSRAGVAIGQRGGSAADLAAAAGQQRPQRGGGGRRRGGGAGAGIGPPPSPQERPARAAAPSPSPGYMPPRMQPPARAAPAGRRPTVEEESAAGMSLDRGGSLMDDGAGGSISLGRLASLSDIGMNPEYGLPSLQQQYLQRFGGAPPAPPPHAAAFAFPQQSWWQGKGQGQGQAQGQGLQQGRGGMEAELPGGYNNISAREHDAALAFAGQFGQPPPPHHPASHPPMPPAARSLLYTLSMGADGEAQRSLIPEVCCGRWACCCWGCCWAVGQAEGVSGSRVHGWVGGWRVFKTSGRCREYFMQDGEWTCT